MHKSNQAFGEWCRENGFGDIEPSVRANAIKLVQEPSVLQSLQDTAVAHPTAVLAAHRKSQQPAEAKTKGKRGFKRACSGPVS